MARIASQEKLGFYPTPQVVVELIKSCLGRAGDGRIRIYDPCAGVGDAVAQLASDLQAESYGVELDTKRAEQAKKNLGRVIHGDSFRVSVRGGSMSCLFLNPPYYFATEASTITTSDFLIPLLKKKQPSFIDLPRLGTFFAFVSHNLFHKPSYSVRLGQIIIQVVTVGVKISHFHLRLPFFPSSQDSSSLSFLASSFFQ